MSRLYCVCILASRHLTMRFVWTHRKHIHVTIFRICPQAILIKINCQFSIFKCIYLLLVLYREMGVCGSFSRSLRVHSTTGAFRMCGYNKPCGTMSIILQTFVGAKCSIEAGLYHFPLQELFHLIDTKLSEDHYSIHYYSNKRRITLLNAIWRFTHYETILLEVDSIYASMVLIDTHTSSNKWNRS